MSNKKILVYERTNPIRFSNEYYINCTCSISFQNASSPSGSTIFNVLPVGNETYKYNLLDQLTSSSGSWGIYNYTYDPDGNLISLVQNGNTTSFTYGSNNQLLTMGSINFTYDNDGNMLTEVNGSQSWGYSYNYANQLVKVTLNSQLVQTNLYESNGNRMMVTDNGSSVVYVYEGGTIIYEKNMTSGQVTDRFYANGLQVADLMSNGTVQYFHEDALGSIRIVTTSAGNIAFSSDYLPFGQSVNSTGIEEFQYTGKSVDSVTGLYYYGARFYDPSIYRFITADSYVGSLQDPLSQNRYIYAEDNPEAMMDPTGHFAHGGIWSAEPNRCNLISEASTASSAVMNAWNGLSGQQQAIIVTAACAAFCIATLGAGTPLAASMIFASAAVNSGVYVAVNGKRATFMGSAFAATWGGLSASVGFAGSPLYAAYGAVPALAFVGGLNFGIDYTSGCANAEMTGTTFHFGWVDFLNVGLSALSCEYGDEVAASFAISIGFTTEEPTYFPGVELPTWEGTEFCKSTTDLAQTAGTGWMSLVSFSSGNPSASVFNSAFKIPNVPYRLYAETAIQ